MVQVRVDYQGHLRCLAEHEPSKSRLITDAPVDNQGKGESFSPTDLVATALGSCMATIMGIYAERHEIDLSGMWITVDKQMSQSGPRRIARLTVEIHLPLPPDHPQREAIERAALSCPVHHSLSEEMEKPVQFHWQGVA